MKGQNVLLKSTCDEWSTPDWIFNQLNSEFSFNLDPCATKKNAKCKKYITRLQGGLHSIWSNVTKSKSTRAFVNPPYSDIKQWVRKCYIESLRGSLVVMLIPARVDISYWHDYIFPYAREIRFIRGRLKFNKHKNPATFPSAVIIFDVALHQKDNFKHKGLKITTIVNRNSKPKKGTKRVNGHTKKNKRV
jgi:phage N-6-adenine-methyltransferase